MKLISENINIDFLGKLGIAKMLSGILILGGLASLVINGGPRFGVDFKGGTQIQVAFANPVDISEVREALNGSNMGIGGSGIKIVGNNIQLTSELIEGDSQISNQIKTILMEKFSNNTITIESTEAVSPVIGDELKSSAIYSIIAALFFLVIYISWRFEFKFAVGAIAALIHDVIITVGLFSIFDKEITLAIVAALLAIVGYSLNDTIVVSDRIRENIKLLKREKFSTIINISLNQTLSRTIITSLTTLLVVVLMFFFGGAGINSFAFALIIGITIGTYSSIFVASPLVLEYTNWKESKKGK